MFRKITMLAGVCAFALSLSAPSATADEGAARANTANPWTECGINVVVSADWLAAAMMSPASAHNMCEGYRPEALPAKRDAQNSWRRFFGEPPRAFAAHLKAKNRNPAQT